MSHPLTKKTAGLSLRLALAALLVSALPPRLRADYTISVNIRVGGTCTCCWVGTPGGCTTSAPVSYSFPFSQGGLDRNSCTMVASQINSANYCQNVHCVFGGCTASQTDNHYCSVNASCSGFDSTGNDNLGGNGITSGAGGLGNNFGTTRLAGLDQGQPTFTSHATTANAQWMEEAQRRKEAAAKKAIQAGQECRKVVSHGGPANIIYPCNSVFSGGKFVPRGPEKVYNWLVDKLPGGKKKSGAFESPIGSLRRSFTPETTVNYEARYLGRIARPAPEYGGTIMPQAVKYGPGDERRTEQVPLEPIKGGGQPAGGVGASQGAPDTLPPPTPNAPMQDRGGGDVRCPKESPYYNPKYGSCYYTVEQCNKNMGPGKSCPDKSAPLTPIAQPPKPPAQPPQPAQPPAQPPQPPQPPPAPVPGEPALNLRGVMKCRKAWWLNSQDNNCYNDEAACKAASSAGARASDAGPLCYQTNP